VRVAACTALLRHAARHVGRRGAFLLFLALVDVVLGYGLTQPLPLGLSAAAVYKPFTDILPLTVWAWWWLTVGAACAAAALYHTIRPVAFGLAAMMKAAWSIGYLAGWHDKLPLYARGYQTAAIFVTLAGVVLLVSNWRENGQ
jgi:hypothetical protein